MKSVTFNAPTTHVEKTPRQGVIRQSLAEWVLCIVVGIGVALSIIAGTYLFEKPKLLVGVIGGPIYIWMTLRWPEIGILMLVGLLAGIVNWRWLPIISFGPFSLHIYDLMLVWLLGIVFLRATSWHHFRLYYSPLTVALLLFMGALAIVSIHSVFFLGLGLNAVFRRVRVMAQWMVFIPTFQLLRDEDSVRRLLAGLWGLTAILAVGVLAREFIPLHKALVPVSNQTLSTAGQTFEDVKRVFFEGDRLLFIMIPITLTSLSIVPSSEKSRFWFLARFLLLGILLIWLFRSFQRNYWLTTAGNLLILFVMFSARYRWQSIRRMIPVIILLAVSLQIYQMVHPLDLDKLSYIATDRLESLLNDPTRSDTSVQWRVVETRYALKRFRENLLFGYGIARLYRPPMVEEIESGFELGWYVHNTYLWIAIMMGLMGLIPFLGLILGFIWRCLRLWQTVPDADLRAIVLGAGVAFVGLSVSNLVAPHYIQSSSLVVYPVIMGIVETIIRLANEKNRQAQIKLHPD